jgi:hypothetical protein
MSETEQAWAARVLNKQSDAILDAIKEMPGQLTLDKIKKHLAARGFAYEHEHITGSLLNLLHRGLMHVKNGGGQERQVVTVNDIFTIEETPWPR